MPVICVCGYYRKEGIMRFYVKCGPRLHSSVVRCVNCVAVDL